jgi:hypothetical protein
MFSFYLLRSFRDFPFAARDLHQWHLRASAWQGRKFFFLARIFACGMAVGVRG